MIHFLNPHDFPAVSEFATVPMIMCCPACGGRHIDEEKFADVPHHTHACQHCGHVWRPAKINTHGVQFLPGFKNDKKPWIAPALRKLVPPVDDFSPKNEG